MLKDGKYKVKHIFGMGCRTIDVKNGMVLCGSHKFNQSFFFEVNKVVCRL